MKSQMVVVSAYMAVALLIVAMATIYVALFPKMTTSMVSTNIINVREIIGSRIEWNAKELAYTIFNKYNAKYVYVNITVVYLPTNKVVRNDYYVLKPLGNYKITYYSSYNMTRLTSTGYLYIINVKVGIG